MGRVTGRLNSLKISHLYKIGQAGKYNDGGNLLFRVTAAKNANWVFRYAKQGIERSIGLGGYPIISLQEARKKAEQYRALIAKGIDPLEAKRTQQLQQAEALLKLKTLKEASLDYINTHRPTWRNAKHAAQWLSTLNSYAFPISGNKPLCEVTTDDIVSILSPIWRDKPETASRLRGRLECILDWAKTRNYREGENPARWRGHLEYLLPKKVRLKKHYNALPYNKLPQFMAQLLRCDGVAKDALAFAILTNARTGDVIGADWGEFNLTTKTWIIPATRSKTKTDYRVPLSEAVIEILLRQYSGETPSAGLVFRNLNNKGLSNGAMLALLDRLAVRNLTTVHGFRTTFRTWGQDLTSYPRELLEMALNHAVGSDVERAYARSDMFQKRLTLANEWAGYALSFQA